MNRKKTLWYIFVFIAGIAFVVGNVWIIKLWMRERDPRWQAAKEIYRVEKALQQVDQDYKLESLSEVYHYEIKRLDGSVYFITVVLPAILMKNPRSYLN